MTRYGFIFASLLLGLAIPSAAHAAGETGVCLVETDGVDAGRLRRMVTAAGAEVGATIQVIQVGVRRDGDVAPVIDRLVASGCHLIGVTSNGPARAILVLSAADGPMPQTRMATMVVGQLGLEDIVVFVNRLDQNSDPELLELVRLEMRELMSSSGLPGEDIPFEQCTPGCRGEPFVPGG